MEKADYRESLELLKERFPDRVTISLQETAKVLGVNIKTVYSARERVKNPLPSIQVAKNRYVVPITSLAKWMA